MATATHGGRTLTMSQSVGQVRLRRDGPVERNAHAVEIGACLAGIVLIAMAAAAWAPIAAGLGLDMRIAVTLSALSGSWPLLRLGVGGVRQETVFDVASQELRQYRITAGGRARPIRALPLDLVDSVHIRRGGAGMPAQLVARDASGARIDIGTAPLTQLERMHLEIVAALHLAPGRTASPRPRPVPATPAIA